MSDPRDWIRHSASSDPGRYAALLDVVPTDIPSLSAVARNLIAQAFDADKQ